MSKRISLWRLEIIVSKFFLFGPSLGDIYQIYNVVSGGASNAGFALSTDPSNLVLSKAPLRLRC